MTQNEDEENLGTGHGAKVKGNIPNSMVDKSFSEAPSSAPCVFLTGPNCPISQDLADDIKRLTMIQSFKPTSVTTVTGGYNILFKNTSNGAKDAYNCRNILDGKHIKVLGIKVKATAPTVLEWEHAKQRMNPVTHEEVDSGGRSPKGKRKGAGMITGSAKKEKIRGCSRHWNGFESSHRDRR
jgi:hypothetical protein